MCRIAGATAIETAEVPARKAKTSDTILRARTLLLKSIILIFPSFNLASDPVLGIVAFPSSRSLPDLMIGVYRERRFAKMTALPDNLTETPHSHAGHGFRWTFSRKS
jgi:hypothetical protein